MSRYLKKRTKSIGQPPGSLVHIGEIVPEKTKITVIDYNEKSYTSRADLPVQERFIRTIQPGRQRMVLLHVVLPSDYRPEDMTSFDAVRARVQNALCEAHVATIADVLFTADRQWGAPLSEGGSFGPTSS